MKIGMMWFDRSNRPLEVKIQDAAVYYRKKYGTTPNLVFVPPSAAVAADSIEVRAADYILPHHLWIGQAEEVTTARQRVMSKIAITEAT